MKTHLGALRITALSLLLACVGSSVSCMATYDANGHPRPSVDPAVAVAGVAAAGILGYAVANHNHHDHYYGGPVYYGGPAYYGGGNYRTYGRAYSRY